MKLLFCLSCQDIISLRNEIKSCECGKTFGARITAGYFLYSSFPKKVAVPIEIDTKSLIKAIKSSYTTSFSFFGYVLTKNNNNFVEVSNVDIIEQALKQSLNEETLNKFFQEFSILPPPQAEDKKEIKKTVSDAISNNFQSRLNDKRYYDKITKEITDDYS